MTNFSSLEKGCPAGIPFSKCRDYMNQMNQTNQVNQKSHMNQAKKTKRKGKRTRRERKKTRRSKVLPKVPPKGVVIRKKGKLYRSTGRKLIMI